jgi:hypothetical protein
MAKQNMLQREVKRNKLVKKFLKKRHNILLALKGAKKFNGYFFIAKKITTFTGK